MRYIGFVHTIGNVIGGDARIGDRVRIMGNVTIGTAKDNGYPRIGSRCQHRRGRADSRSDHRGCRRGRLALTLWSRWTFQRGALAVGVPATIREAEGSKRKMAAES